MVETSKPTLLSDFIIAHLIFNRQRG